MTADVLFAKKPTSVVIAPGKTVSALPPDAVDAIAIAELQPAGDGTYRPVARLAKRWIINNDANLKTYGIPLSYRSVLRLIRGGFIDGRHATPKTWQFDYYSYLRHLEACKDPEFWTPRRLELWNRSI